MGILAMNTENRPHSSGIRTTRKRKWAGVPARSRPSAGASDGGVSGLGAATTTGLDLAGAAVVTGDDAGAGGGCGAWGFSPAASMGNWAVAGSDSGGLEKLRISTSWL